LCPRDSYLEGVKRQRTETLSFTTIPTLLSLLSIAYPEAAINWKNVKKFYSSISFLRGKAEERRLVRAEETAGE